MPNPVTVNIKGLDVLQRKLEELPDKVARKVLDDGLIRAGAVVLAEIVQQTPKETGFLKAHIHAKLGKKKLKDLARSIFIGPDADAYYPGKEEK